MTSHTIGAITRSTASYSLIVHNRGLEGEYFVIIEYNLDRTEKRKVNVGSKSYITKLWGQVLLLASTLGVRPDEETGP